jgi:hypothetical protein
MTTYDHVNSDCSQSVRGIQSLTPRNKFGSGAESEPRRKPTDDVGRMSGSHALPEPSCKDHLPRALLQLSSEQ